MQINDQGNLLSLFAVAGVRTNPGFKNAAVAVKDNGLPEFPPVSENMLGKIVETQCFVVYFQCLKNGCAKGQVIGGSFKIGSKVEGVSSLCPWIISPAISPRR